MGEIEYRKPVSPYDVLKGEMRENAEIWDPQRTFSRHICALRHKSIERIGRKYMEITLTQDNFDAEVLSSDVPVLVDFWAAWCGPCRMLAPVIEEIAGEYEGKIKVGKVNADEEEALAARFGIGSIPTLILFRGGEAVATEIGFKPKEEIVSMIEGNI